MTDTRTLTTTPPAKPLSYQPLSDDFNDIKSEIKPINSYNGVYDGTEDIGIVSLDIVKVSKLATMEDVRKAFNVDCKSPAIIHSKIGRGNRIGTNEVILASRNQIPELDFDRGLNITTANSLTDSVKKIGVYNKNQKIYGKYGKYVLNIPFGHYALVKSDNPETPYAIYDGGLPHVIDDKRFEPRQKNDEETNLSAQVELVKKSEPYIKHGNIHILNIPQNHYAKVWLGPSRRPLLLPHRPEPYVFNDIYFELDYKNKNEYYIHQATPYIHHGNIHILQIPPGKFVKAWDGPNQIPEIIESQGHPIVRNSPNFKVANPDKPFENVLQEYVQHDTIHILRVPPGKIATVMDGLKAEILESKDEPYIYKNNPYFQLIPASKTQPFKNAGSYYIKHGLEHRLRVPAGMIATVLEHGTIPLFLEARKEPYIFKDNAFQLVKPKDDSTVTTKLDQKYSPNPDQDPDQNPELLFESATKNFIELGSLKRIIPPIGHVAVINNNNVAQIMTSDNDAEHTTDSKQSDHKHDSKAPIIIKDAARKFEYFLDTTVQDLIFPSEKTKEHNRLAKKTPEECDYEVFYTSDGVKMAVKLLVQFEIPDPQKAVSKLRTMPRIQAHIEHTTRADLQQAIQNCTSQDIANSDITKLSKDRRTITDDKDNSAPSAPFRYQIDHLKEALKEHLLTYGIQLVRLNIEEAKILDPERIKKSEKASLETADIYIREATIDRKSKLAKLEADQDAAIKTIQQNQLNSSTKATAEAEFKAAEFKANALRESYKADADKYYYQQEKEQQVIALKAKTAREAFLESAKTEREAAIAKAQGERDAAALVAEAITLKGNAENAIKLEAEKIRVQAKILEAEGIAKAFGDNPGYAYFKAVEANAATIAAGLNGANINMVLGSKPEELAMAVSGNPTAMLSQFANNPMSLFAMRPPSQSVLGSQSTQALNFAPGKKDKAPQSLPLGEALVTQNKSITGAITPAVSSTPVPDEKNEKGIQPKLG